MIVQLSVLELLLKLLGNAFTVCDFRCCIRSGVLPISVATDGINFSCAFDCAFCPNEIVANGAPRDMARSYLSSEGTFIRGALENFEGAGQVKLI